MTKECRVTRDEVSRDECRGDGVTRSMCRVIIDFLLNTRPPPPDPWFDTRPLFVSDFDFP